MSDDPNRDPYEIDDETYQQTFGHFNPDEYLSRRPARAKPDENPTIAQPPRQAPQPAGDFPDFNADNYLQGRGLQAPQQDLPQVDPDQPVPLQGFDTLPPVAQQSRYVTSGSAARIARAQTLRTNDRLLQTTPTTRILILVVFGIGGVLLGSCCMLNLLLLVWYTRR